MSMAGPGWSSAHSTVTANWMRELTRFAPKLRAYRHWGPDRLRRPVLFAPWDVVVAGYDAAVADEECWP